MANRPSNMAHSFSRVPTAEIPRSSFQRNHGVKTTFDAGQLIPFFRDEALPGDTKTLRTTAFARLATPLHPFLDNIRLSTFYFSVPVRLVWDNWVKMQGEQTNPGDSTDYTVPQMVAPASVGHAENSLSDYLGLPTKVPDYTHSALYHRAYALIWNEWFRDQNLQNSLTISTGDGPDLASAYSLQKRGKRHDYFTSCLPWPQKGDAVAVPAGGLAPVLGIGKDDQVYAQGQGSRYETGGTGTTVYASSAGIDQAAAGQRFSVEEDPNNPGFPGIWADLSQATASSINVLRQAFQIQKLLERDARGGTRYVEQLKAHWGVTSPDFRHQRPEYLGGSTGPVNVNPVAQTSSTDGTSPQGNLAGVGTSVLSGHGFTASFTEHCLILGLVCATADLNYQQGLDRDFSRLTRYDYYIPALSHIGEQTVLNKEIFVNNDPNDELVFGYQERYAEYRYKNSYVSGAFRSNHTASLDTWHLSQDFASLPGLNSDFIEENPPIDRVIAVPTEPHFLFDAFHELRDARPMPMYGVPGLIDHF